MIPTFLALASPLLFNQLGLWRIHHCVPSFQPGATSVSTSWHNRLSAASSPWCKDLNFGSASAVA